MIGSVLFFMAARQYSYIEDRKNQISIRCENALLTAKTLEKYYEQQSDKGVPDVTLWNEKKDININAGEYFTGNGFTLAEGYGDLEKILPGHLITGCYPGKEDTSGCAISRKGAVELFGNDKVAGKEITVEGKTYIIRGVIDWREQYLWIQNPAAQGFQNIELIYRDEIPQVSEARQWVAQVSGGRISAVLAGSSYRAFGRLILSVPLWVLWIVLLRQLFRYTRRIQKGYLHMAVYFMVFAVLVLGTAAGLRYSICFGTDYIPSRWSDFAFYQGKWESVRMAAKEIQSLQSLPGDQELLSHSRMAAWMSAASAGIMATSLRTFLWPGKSLSAGSHTMKK